MFLWHPHYLDLVGQWANICYGDVTYDVEVTIAKVLTQWSPRYYVQLSNLFFCVSKDKQNLFMIISLIDNYEFILIVLFLACTQI